MPVFLRDGNMVHIFSAEPAIGAEVDYFGSVAVHPGETPTSTELIRRLGVRATYFEYDFADDAGATGGLYISEEIPSGAYVIGGKYKVQTTFITAGADAGTIALGVQAAGDLVTAIAVSDASNPWDAATPVNIPALTNDALALTARRRIRLDIAGQAVTAGKLVGYVLWTGQTPAYTAVAV